MRPLPIANPPNPWASTDVRYLEGEAPHADLRVFEDHTRQILSKNDSPDVGFTWSVNPYRGCFHACAYCLDGETPILMGDGSARPLRDLRVGETVYGTSSDGTYRHCRQTLVLAHWRTMKPAYRVRLMDGTELIASGDHRFLTQRGWTHVLRGQQTPFAGPHLTPGDRLLGLDPLRFGLPQDAFRMAPNDIEGSPIESMGCRRVLSIEPLGRDLPMYDITTGTGDFIARGVVSHNCYARPSHEYLSFGAGTDFERKIVVKPDAAALLREAFDKPAWKGELVVFSGVTDCYQPLEASYGLTRGCLEVCAEYKNPAAIITKSPLIERDVDVLVRLGEVASVAVVLSIPFWDPEKARALEPYVATPARRMRVVEKLAARGVRVGVNVAPIVPGLGDEEIGKVLTAARDAGATFASWVMLRLPGPVQQIFEERLREALPLRAEKVLRRVREVRGGKLYRSKFYERGTGEGNYAEAIAALFEQTAKRLGLSVGSSADVKISSTFERPLARGAQLPLF